MKDEEITAVWARKQATAVMGEKILKEVEKCIDLIKKAVAKNEMSTNVFSSIDELTEAELHRRGFKIRTVEADFRDPRDTSYIVISW